MILQAVFERAELLKLPAMILGDLNASLDELVSWPLMSQRGWSDSAELHFQKSGMAPGPTYEESSRIDFILLSTLASHAFLRYYTSGLPVSDHRQVYAEFQWDRVQSHETIWKMPRDFQDLGVDGRIFEAAKVPVTYLHEFDKAMEEENIERARSVWTQSMEAVAASVLQKTHGTSLPKSFQGKNTCKFQQRPRQQCLVRRGRDHTLQMPCEAMGVQFRQRITQIRRIDAAISQCNAAGEMNNRRLEAIRLTWRSVLQASGFQPSLPLWCLRELDLFCPLDPPSSQVMKSIRDKMAPVVPKWRSLYQSQRLSSVRQTFREDWDKGGRLFFRALQGERSPPVDAIDRVDLFRIRSRRLGKKSDAKFRFRLQHEDMQLVKVGQTWRQNEAMGVVSDIREGMVMVKPVKGVMKTGLLQAFTMCTDPDQSLGLATGYWSSFWNGSHKVNLADTRVSDLIIGLPELTPLDPEISMPELETALKMLQPSKARGMDAVTNWELKYLCEDFRTMLRRFLNLVTVKNVWPKALTIARMHLIKK